MTDAERNTLADYIDAAVQAFTLQHGAGGMATGYVIMLEYIDNDGETATAIARPETQPVYRSLGYVSYLEEWFKDDVRSGIAYLVAQAEEDDDE